MTIQVDARLHLSSPEIILRNGTSGRILMRWSQHTIRQWLAHGDICYSDLARSDYDWFELLTSTR